MTDPDITHETVEESLRTELSGMRVNKLPRAEYEKDPSQDLTCRSCGEPCESDYVYCIVISGGSRDWDIAMFNCSSCGPHEPSALSRYRPPCAIVRTSTRRDGPWLVVDSVEDIVNTNTE